MAPDAEPDARLRSADIISLMSPRSLWRVIRGVVRAPFEPGFAGHPIAVCWFTNFSCNARCAFCCKAAEIRAGRVTFPPLDLDRGRELLAKIRASVEMLYLSGGEPTIHPNVVPLLEEARVLDFSSIGISSNLIALDRCPEILDLIDALSVSLHAPDPAGLAARLGVPVRLAERAFENLERVREHARRSGLRVLVNCVVTEENLDVVPDLVEFTRSRGFLLEIVPANDHGRRPPLAGNARYEALIQDLVAMRERGEAPHLAGSTAYYERIRTFEPFRCFPYGVPNIMPDGRLATPCDVSEQVAVNVLDHPSLKAAVKASRPHLGDYPCREGQCFKAGIVERSRLFGLLVSGRSAHA